MNECISRDDDELFYLKVKFNVRVNKRVLPGVSVYIMFYEVGIFPTML